MFKLPTKTELYNILLKQECEKLRQCEEAVRELFKDEKYYQILQRLYYEYQLPNKFFYALQKDNVDLCNLQISLENGFYKIKYCEITQDQLENYPEYDENTFSITIYASGIITFDEKHRPEFNKLSLYTH